MGLLCIGKMVAGVEARVEGACHSPLVGYSLYFSLLGDW